MGIIMYHKQLVLDTEEWGLDFTLSAKHGVIPVVGSIAEFNTDSFSTWRTAFRECVKLTQQDDIESQQRLKTWRTVAHGNHAKWSLRGANDAVNYVESGEDLQLSFEWAWLKEFFYGRYYSEYLFIR